MYCYVTCRPDIGYAICCLSKFSTCPSEIHFTYLKSLALYLHCTKHWGICYHQQSATMHTHLPGGNFSNPPPLLPESLPPMPPTPTGPNPICFVDAAYATDL